MTNALVAICVFLIPSYIFRFSLLGVPTNVFEITVLATLVSFFLERIILSFSGKNVGKNIKFGYVAAALVLFFSFISVLVANESSKALGIFKGWFAIPAILYFIILNQFEDKKIKLLTIPLFVSLLLVSLWAILQKLGIVTTLFYQVGDVGFSDYIVRSRAFGPFESPNYLAMFLVPTMFLTLPIIGFFKNTFDKILIVALYILPLFALYASHSLGGLLAFGFSVISILAFGLAKLYRAKLVNSGYKITLLAVGLVVVALGFSFIFSSIGQETYTRSLRMDIYHYSIQLIKFHPVLGIGLGQYQAAVEGITRDNLGFVLYGLSYALHPHNIFLAYWLNLGLFGFLSFLYLLGSYFWNLGKRGGDILFLSSLFAGMVAIIIHGLVDTTYFKNDLSVIFWLLLACSVIVGVKNGTAYKQK
jgi:O-antigen ligase